jgi:ABC-type multidrug transport system fused ATPase/permease subunit
MFTAFRSGRAQRPTGPKESFQRPTANELRRLFRYLRPYRNWMAIAILSLVFGAALGLIFPWIIQNLVDSVFNQENLDALNRITIFLIITFLIRSVFMYLQVYSLSYIGERMAPLKKGSRETQKFNIIGKTQPRSETCTKRTKSTSSRC